MMSFKKLHPILSHKSVAKANEPENLNRIKLKHVFTTKFPPHPGPDLAGGGPGAQLTWVTKWETVVKKPKD